MRPLSEAPHLPSPMATGLPCCLTRCFLDLVLMLLLLLPPRLLDMMTFYLAGLAHSPPLACTERCYHAVSTPVFTLCLQVCVHQGWGQLLLLLLPPSLLLLSLPSWACHPHTSKQQPDNKAGSYAFNPDFSFFKTKYLLCFK